MAPYGSKTLKRKLPVETKENNNHLYEGSKMIEFPCRQINDFFLQKAKSKLVFMAIPGTLPDRPKLQHSLLPVLVTTHRALHLPREQRGHRRHGEHPGSRGDGKEKAARTLKR